jgi:hypothetical protein
MNNYENDLGTPAKPKIFKPKEKCSKNKKISRTQCKENRQHFQVQQNPNNQANSYQHS